MRKFRYWLLTSLSLLLGVVYSSCPAQPAAAGRAPSSVSAEMAELLTSLVAGTRAQPSVNAVDAYAAAFHWHRMPPEMNALLNAKVGYAGVIEGHKLLLGSDGSNDIFSVSVREGFSPDEATAALRHVYVLKKQDSEDSDGQRFETYILVDRGTDVGMLTVTYGVAQQIRGVGTLSFASMERVRKEIKAQHQ
jgi:hypothetical protein